jgi:hypothetical protein
MATDETQNGTSKRALIEVSPDLAARFGDPRLPLALVAGVVGAAALLIGYFGVSGTLDPAKQLPYLISGGVGGLFLLGVAAALLFSADLGATRADIGRLSEQVRELSEQVAELQASLEEPAPRSRPRSPSSTARKRS